MKKTGLIGYPLGHSFSKKYFEEKFKQENIPGWQYELYPIENIAELPGLIDNNPGLCGLNVTIPYKQAVIPYLDEMQEEAREIGAVNAINITRHDNIAHLSGYNTDAYGFEKSLLPLLKPEYSSALILGTGGSAKAVSYVLRKLGINFHFVSRSKKNGITYDALDKKLIETHKLIINCTPLGMSPDIEICPPLPYEFIGPGHLCYDLIYNPERTLFLKKALEQGAEIKNGLEMLYLQAEKSWEIFSA